MSKYSVEIKKISKPYANTTIDTVGEIVSFSPRALKIAIGKQSISISKDEMNEILETRLNEQASKIIHLFNTKIYGYEET